MRLLIATLLLTVLFSGSIQAQERDSLYRWSVVAVIASSGADAASSWGKRELNPVLGSQFGVRSMLIKGGLTGTCIGVQFSLTRQHPQMRRRLAWTNFALSGVYTGLAIHNWRIR